jgi:hypothetical protein
MSSKALGRLWIWTIGLCTAFAAAVVLYTVSAPPIVKAQIRHTGRWPALYAPLLWGLENNSPVIHGPLRWYFNRVWRCDIVFFSDPPPNEKESP